MGIGNPLAAQGVRPVEPKLITPHGDWERCIKGDAARLINLSLPLMGIRNPQHRRIPAAHDAAHYPSWGFGTRGACEPRQ